MQVLSDQDVSGRILEALRCEGLGFATMEGMSCIVRAAASLRCPCTYGSLAAEVKGALKGLCSSEVLGEVEAAIEMLTGYGDLIEAESTSPGKQTRLLYARLPSFVERDGDSFLILGIGSMDHLGLPVDLQSRLQRRGYTRRLAGAGVRDRLIDAGFLELDQWAAPPSTREAPGLVTELDEQLDGMADVRDAPELRILDPDKDVRYYPGRWSQPGSKSGRFVARRPRAYGNELWCYVLLEDGQPRRLLDLVGSDTERPCDEALRLQCALDAVHGTPQVFSVGADGTERILRLYSPVPQWTRRRWDILGEPVADVFLGWRLPAQDIEDERAFLRDYLWLEEIHDSDRISPGGA